MEVKRILRYPIGTATKRLFIYSDAIQTSSIYYVDTNYARDEDRKSTSRILIKYRDCSLKNQTSTATSTAEAEINTVAWALIVVSWIQDILKSILWWSDLEGPNQLLVNDNQVGLANVKESLYKPENRNLGKRFHWIRKEIWNESVSNRYEYTNSMLADELHKSLDRMKYNRFWKRLAWRTLEERTWEDRIQEDRTPEDRDSGRSESGMIEIWEDQN